MNNMGGDDDVDLPEVDGADDVSTLVRSKYTRGRRDALHVYCCSLKSNLRSLFSAVKWLNCTKPCVDK